MSANDKGDLGLCNWPKLRVQLKEDAHPSRVPNRAMNPSKQKDLKDKINKLQQKDLQFPTRSGRAAPTVLVPKTGGSYCLFFNYGKLKAHTVETSWLLPRNSDIMNIFEGSIFFSSLDLCSGFNQMEIEDEDRELTFFITLFEFCQRKRMPMRLGIPGVFKGSWR